MTHCVMAWQVLAVFMFLINGFVNGFSTGVLHLLGENPAVGFVPIWAGCACCFYGLIIIFYEKWFLHGMYGTSFFICMGILIEAFWIYDGPAFMWFSFVNWGYLEMLGMQCICLFALIGREIIKRAAHTAIQLDHQSYEHMWQPLSLQPRTQQQVADLEEFVESLPSHVTSPVSEMRQVSRGWGLNHQGQQLECSADTGLCRREEDEMLQEMGRRNPLQGLKGPSLSHSYTSRLLGWPRPSAQTQTHVASLDQLYLQAALLQEIFADKVQGWACAANGYAVAGADADGLTNSRTNDLINWADALARPELKHQVKFASIKRVDRCFEKASRSYANDVSRLVDIVRQTIIFHSLEDLTECLKAVKNDDTVKIMRLKNRYSSTYDSTKSAGYRDCNLNLLVSTPSSQRLQVVCVCACVSVSVSVSVYVCVCLSVCLCVCVHIFLPMS